MSIGRWRALLGLLNEQVPAANELYVEPKRAASLEVQAEFEDEPTSRPKFLLVGARGGGKSTELNRISLRLAPRTQLVGIDLDGSGVNASTVGAFDLLYLSSLALLNLLPKSERGPLFDALSRAYADQAAAELGPVDQAVDSVATFGLAASESAKSVGLLVPGVRESLAVVKVGKLAARLFNRGVVAESSPQGSRLAQAAQSIAEELETREPDRPPCVLIDGLERMNGESETRFRELFEETSLLAHAPWATVISSPPCTMTVTNGAESRGWRSKVVWGFGVDQVDSLVELLRRRFEVIESPSENLAGNDSLLELAKHAGCLPRHAVRVCREAVRSANRSQRNCITEDDVRHAVRDLAEGLGQGLTEEDFVELRHVRSHRSLRRGEAAARLFADGRILAYPPSSISPFVDWRVHPSLEPYLRPPGEAPPEAESASSES